MKIIVFVGLPGAGKSTKAKEFESQGFIIHSPDAIRNELNMHNLDQTEEVYNILHERIINDIKLGHNVVYDSTNITRKRRIKFLKMIEEFTCEKICYVFIVPVEICKERNSKRTGYSKVSDREYDILIDRFNIPMSDEGWNKIIFDVYDDNIIMQKGEIKNG